MPNIKPPRYKKVFGDWAPPGATGGAYSTPIPHSWIQGWEGGEGRKGRRDGKGKGREEKKGMEWNGSGRKGERREGLSSPGVKY